MTIIIFIKVIGPLIIAHLKRKIPGFSEPNNDIDAMIRRQKEKLKAQYGLVNTGTESCHENHIKNIIQDTKWGSSKIIKEVQHSLKVNFAYVFADSTLSTFFLTIERKNYFYFLSANNQNNNTTIINYTCSLFIFLTTINEIKNRKLYLAKFFARKINSNEFTLSLAIQLKILTEVKELNPEINEKIIFQSDFSLHQFSEDTIQKAITRVLQKEANLWAVGVPHFFEELSLNLKYAFFLTPFPEIKKNDDLQTCFQILGIKESADEAEIKKAFKIFAMSYHPDKIEALKLPQILDKKAKEKFNTFQRSYEIIIHRRKK